MGKKIATDGDVPKFYATTAYKQWVREQREKHGWSLVEFAQRLRRADSSARATSGGISQFLGPEDEVPMPSNTTLMPAINKVFGIAPPPICNPTDTFSQLRDRLSSKWSQLTDREQRKLFVIFSELLGDSSDDR